MTGFARSEGQCNGFGWAWELRSVNGRGLEVRCRLPAGFEGLEAAVRERAAAKMRRGNLLAALTLAAGGAQVCIRINETVLEQILAILPHIQERIQGAPQPDAASILSLRGVIESLDDAVQGEPRTRLEEAILADLGHALDTLVAVRRGEGERLAPVLAGHLARLADLNASAAGLAAVQPQAILARLREQIEALLDGNAALNEDRLNQEAAILAAKADLREELDRIGSHTSAAQALLAKSTPVGRQFDFICQELNREASTLCAKSADVELTRVGIDMKTTIDQLREQVQNIE
jgi:uncharacterized protein (TIGR00255 family)